MDDVHYNALVEYRQITDFPMYRVGSDGSLWSSWRKNEWREMAVVLDKDGYRKALLQQGKGKAKRYTKVHTLILEMFIGPCPEKMEACHIDGNKLNNRSDNLRWDTHKNNIADRTKHGTVARGSRSGQSKLKEEDMPEILLRIQQGESYESIANRFGVTVHPVWSIARNRSWRHLEREEVVRGPHTPTKENIKRAVIARIEANRKRKLAIESKPSEN